MPENDLFDLDSAFARLEHDVAGVSSPRGADLAVATARRRRRTTFGAAAAVAVLAVGGVVLAQGLHHPDTTFSPTSALPTAAPLNAATLTAATEGWTSAWGPADAQADQVLSGAVSHCLESSPVLNQIAEPARASGDISFSAGQAAAFATLADFGDKSAQADTLWTSLTDTFGQCPTVTTSDRQVWDGGEAESYGLSAAGKTEHFWVAREGSAVGLLWIANAPGDVPASADDAVAGAMVAALQLPSSFSDSNSTTTSSASVSPSEVASMLSPGDFAQALGAWQSGWSTTGSEQDDSTLPCRADLSPGASSDQGASLGANGDQEIYAFDSAAAAQTGLQSAVAAFSGCSPSSYDVHTLHVADGSVTVAAGTGATTEVVWMVRAGADVAYIAVPAGATPPPDAVTQRIGKLLLAALSSPGVVSSGPPPVASSSSATTGSGSNGSNPTGSASSSSAAPAG